MTANRNYSSVARLATLTGSINSSATVVPLDQTTGFPTIPFTLVLDGGRAAEEAVTVTNVVGLNCTILRGVDGTAAQPHDAGASARHMATARDYREPAEHIALTSAVHGVGGDLVGTIDTQIMDNKQFTALVTDHTPLTVQAAAGQTAHLMNLSNSAGAVLTYFSVDGRLSVTGIDGSVSSTFTTNSAAVIPMIVRSTVGQSAKLVSIQDSNGTQQASIAADGTMTGTHLISTTSAELRTSDANTIPAIIRVPSGQNVDSLSVQNGSNADVAGIAGEGGAFQLYHGGSNSNFVPFRVHGGSVTVTMVTGATSQGGTIDLSPYGFTVAPLMTLTVRQDNVSTFQRRVGVNIENVPTTTACTYRVVQTSNEVMPSDTVYRVHWIAWQFTPTTSAG